MQSDGYARRTIDRAAWPYRPINPHPGDISGLARARRQKHWVTPALSWRDCVPVAHQAGAPWGRSAKRAYIYG